MKNKLSFIILIYFALINTVSAKEKIKVFYSGFSFSNNYESNKIFTQYTKKIVNNINTEDKLDIISNNLLKEIKKSNFQNINLDLENLLDFRKYPDNAIVMSIVMQHEEFSQEYSNSLKKFSGFYDSYFQILFYDFSDKSLIASIPFEFEIPMLSNEKFDETEVLKRVKEFYLKDKPFKELIKIINQFNIKRKYDLRIGVTNVKIHERALNHMPKNTKNHLSSMKNLIAQTFSKRLSQNHNVAIVPYAEGQSIGKAMKLRFVQSDEIYDIKIPNPDYHIGIEIKGFKKLLGQESAVEDLYLYGSFVNIEIYQPDLNKYYFNESLRGVTRVKIPKGQVDLNDWRKYYYNLEILFDNFSKNIIKQNQKWMKEASKNKIKKKLKELKMVMDKLK
ncbi:hypothetical protein IDG98_01955 [Pelagibacterales bacterium SAG-MED17]|nr:hypothetical protein [Pelagibacterales bacterium SAG-MED17]